MQTGVDGRLGTPAAVLRKCCLLEAHASPQTDQRTRATSLGGNGSVAGDSGTAADCGNIPKGFANGGLNQADKGAPA